MSDLHSRAILVSLRISSWSAKKYDKQVSAEAAAAHGASIEAGRYNKALLPSTVKVANAKQATETNSYKALMQHIAATRVWNYEQTLAWSDDGWRLLPIRNYQTYTDGLRAAQHKFERLLADFVADYPDLKADARRVLNGMFNESEYPSDIRGRFGFGAEFSPVPSGSDFRVALTDAEIQAIAATTESRVKAAFEEAHGDAVKRLYDCVRKIHERLASPDAIFRDSLITNAQDVCDALKRLNVTDDATLEALRKETALLASTTPETLRECPDVRVETANRAQDVLNAFTSAYGANFFGGN